MALAVDGIDRHDASNKMCRQLKSEEDYGKAVLAIYIAAKDVLPSLHY